MKRKETITESHGKASTLSKLTINGGWVPSDYKKLEGRQTMGVKTVHFGRRDQPVIDLGQDNHGLCIFNKTDPFPFYH